MMRFGGALVVASLAFVACSTEEPPGELLDEAGAKAAAEAIVGGTSVVDGELIVEDGFDLWVFDVEMPNDAVVEVYVFATDGALFEVFDAIGPFDYDTLDPLPGQLTYDDARTVAFDEVEGELIAWEVKYTDEGYFYEFYIEQVGDQLWEVKLWADDGEVFVVEPKDAVD